MTKRMLIHCSFVLLVAWIAPSARASATSEASPGKTVAVTVRVIDPDGAAIRDAYVGLIAEWQPASRPLAEEISKKGTALFRVPEGHYFLIAGASGFSASIWGPYELDQSNRDFSIELSRLVPLSGTVTDERGEPIAGARVSSRNGAVLPSVGRLSELALRHLMGGFSTTTDEDGRWTLPFVSGESPVFFEAPGRRAEWRIKPEGLTEPMHVTLRRGSTLMLTTDRSEAGVVLTLSREDDPEECSIPVDLQPRVWARAAAGEVEWSSLPPGTYTIHATVPESSSFMRDSVELANVRLTIGTARKVHLAIPPISRSAPPSMALFVRDVEPGDLGDDLRVSGSSDSGAAETVASFVEPVVGGTVIHFEPATAREPFVAISNDRFLFPTETLAERNGPLDERVMLAPDRRRADVALGLRSADEALALPARGTARLASCDGEGEVTVPVEIGEGGSATMVAPAGCFDLVIRVEPFESLVMNRRLRPGAQSLGMHALRAGASADVRVARGEGEDAVEGARVRAVAMSDSEYDPTAVVVAETLTGENGWASLTGLPPAAELRVDAATKTGERSDFEVLRLEARERRVVDPLRLKQPASLVVDAVVDEAFLTRFPKSHIVSIWARPADPFRVDESVKDTPGETPIRFEPLRPGMWNLTAVVMVERAWGVFEFSQVDLEPGESRRVDATITPEVFEGIVTADGKPIAAKVMLDLGDMIPHFVSNDQGLFHVVLPERGTYQVSAARLTNQGNMNPIGEIAFVDPSRRIEIELPPGGSVTARVVGEDAPVTPGAVVWIERRDRSGLVDRPTRRGRSVGNEGEARFDDLGPGTWTFSVRDERTHRAAEKAVVVEPGENQTIDLVLENTPAIRGTIRDANGSPVARARVECLYVGPTGNPDTWVVESDSTGSFEVALVDPAPVSALCSFVSPLGQVDAARLTVADVADVRLPAATGVLRLPDWSDAVHRDAWWLVSPDGRAIRIASIGLQLGEARSAMTVPALAAGTWRLVRIGSMREFLALAGGLGAALPAIKEIRLEPGTVETMFVSGQRGSNLRLANMEGQ